MREILFKAITIDGNRWIDGALLWDSYKGKKRYYILEDDAVDFQEFEEVIPETVCQFTGLLDKNGNKIFEGDIVRKNIINDFRDFIVLFYVDGFALQRTSNIEVYHQKSIRSPKRINYKDWQTLEITSNIHDK